VRNIGLGDAGPSTLRIDFLNAGPEDVVIGALAAGTSTVVSVDIPRGCYRAGACSFKLNADAGTTVIEADETNNSAQSLCLSPAG
jgi:subtilase family serine protease